MSIAPLVVYAFSICYIVVGVVFFCFVDYGYRGNSKVVQPLSILEDDEEVVSLDKSNCDAEEKANAELSGG